MYRDHIVFDMKDCLAGEDKITDEATPLAGKGAQTCINEDMSARFWEARYAYDKAAG